MSDTVKKLNELSDAYRALKKAKADMIAAENHLSEVMRGVDTAMGDVFPHIKNGDNAWALNRDPRRIDDWIHFILGAARALKAKAYEDDHPWTKDAFPESP